MNQMIEIKSWLDGKVLFSAECSGIKECLEMAVREGKDLSYANLNGASLNRASLDGASLNDASLNDASLNGASLNDASLNRASLDGASLDGARLNRASLDGASLDGASLDGASLNRASLDGASLDGASLDGASLDGASLNRASLNDANLNDASLNGASLNRASLDGASLNRAILNRARLNRASLDRASLNGTRNLPKICKVESLFTKIKAQIDGEGSLNMDSWHTCETTHCIAGWAVVLAGDAGRVAENLLGTNAAGALIILESCHYLSGAVPNFTSSNEEGLEFIEECAKKEVEIA